MAWVAEHNLAGAVSKAGGLGIIAGANAPADVIRNEIRMAREITGNPIGVNVMLIQFSVENYLSIKEKCILSLNPSFDNFFISGLNYFGPLKTSTSTPDIASCEYDCCFYDSYNKVFVYQISLHPTYKGLKKKTAVTFKSTTTDGSNKTIPLKLMFRP